GLVLRAGHGEHWFQALAAQRVSEAAQQVDLLDDLVVADERALAPDPHEVPQPRQLEHGLPDRHEADPEMLRVLALVAGSAGPAAGFPVRSGPAASAGAGDAAASVSRG